MTAYRGRIILVWSICIIVALWLVLHAHYVTDLSAFLPTKPTPLQRLLVDQLRDGPAARLIFVALEGGDVKARADTSLAMAHRLSVDHQFSTIENGAAQTDEKDFQFIFQHRYLLSDAVDPQHFSTNGLRVAIADTVDDLASSSGPLMKSLVPTDPTGETRHVIDGMAHTIGPQTTDGVWVSKDGARTLLLAQTAASGSDTDAQERAITTIRAAFTAAVAARNTAPSANDTEIQLKLSGPGVFAVAARDKIKRAATRLSLIASALVVSTLLMVYRSIPALILGLLPVASGALVGIAAVSLGFGEIHGITLGFGITLIGESVDYSIYFFIQSLRGQQARQAPMQWQRELWPTVRLGMLTSVCGFASLLPSAFPGLAQLGLYSISGLIAAALVTRFVLPAVLTSGFTIRDVAPWGVRLGRWRDAARGRSRGIAVTACLVAGIAMTLLYQHRDTLWSHELAALSPIPLEALRYDAKLRADLAAADVLDLIVVSGTTLEAVLQGAEQVGASLLPLIGANVISDFDNPARYLPSEATQTARREALPERQILRQRLDAATRTSVLKAAELEPFLDAVDAARRAPLLGVGAFGGTSMAVGLAALILHRDARWSALLPLHAPVTHAAAAPAVALDRIAAALPQSRLYNAQILDMKAQTDALYAGYLHEAMRLSLAGFILIVLLLSYALRSARRTAGVLAPLILAVLVVAAGLTLAGQQLTILHLVGLLLTVAVGSNYALFFDSQARHTADAGTPLMLASLSIANLSTVIGFGLLSFSQVPVLEALGVTVAPGAFLALVFSALLTAPAPTPGRESSTSA